MSKRLFSIFLVMAMLLCSFVACSDDKDKKADPSTVESGDAQGDASGESDESSDDISSGSINKFDQITDNREKLVYFSGGSEDVEYIDKVQSVLGDGVSIPAIPAGDVYKFSAGFDVSEFTVMGQDMMDQLGGAMGMDINVLTDGNVINMDGSVDIAGVSAGAELMADENGIYFESPFMLKQPIYADRSFLDGLMGGYTDSEELTNAIGSIAEAFATYSAETLTEENLAHLQSLAVQMLPEDSVTAEKVTLAGVYTKDSVEADCIALNLSGDSLAAVLGSFRQTLYDDAVFKEVTTGFFGGFTDLILAGLVSFGGEGDTVIPSEAEFYDSIFDAVDEMADYVETDDSTTFIMKRYFVNGVDARFDVEIIYAEEHIYVSYWDIYTDDANDYGLVIKGGYGDDEYEMLNMTGGYDTDSASFKAVVNSVEYDAAMDDNGEYTFTETVVPVITMNLERQSGKLSYNFAFDSDGATMSVTGSDNEFSFEMANGEEFAIAAEGTTTTADGAEVISGTVSMTNDGVTNEFDFTVTNTETVTDTKYEQTFKLELGMTMGNASAKLVIDGSLLVDSASGETPVAPSAGDNSVVIDDETDLASIDESLFNDTFLMLIMGMMGETEL